MFREYLYIPRVRMRLLIRASGNRQRDRRARFPHARGNQILNYQLLDYDSLITKPPPWLLYERGTEPSQKASLHDIPTC